jgi:Mg2+ and Co2+ transporter CorA
MLTTAELSHINRLNHIGRQLGVLKRLYTSYDYLINRILEPQKPTNASMKNSHILDSAAFNSMASSQGHLMQTEVMGDFISSASKVRFERLQHRIRIYALAEIEECLNQKESLVMMNFNLIAIKESYSVERLTRITLLLAKVTMLFMPVSLMTAYFSCQLADVEFTVKSYWTWFAGVLSVSIAGLVGFSLLSGTMEGRLYYRTLIKTIWRAFRGVDSRSEKSNRGSNESL